jgi:hypothetical protein
MVHPGAHGLIVGDPVDGKAVGALVAVGAIVDGNAVGAMVDGKGVGG